MSMEEKLSNIINETIRYIYDVPGIEMRCDMVPETFVYSGGFREVVQIKNPRRRDDEEIAESRRQRLELMQGSTEIAAANFAIEFLFNNRFRRGEVVYDWHTLSLDDIVRVFQYDDLMIPDDMKPIFQGLPKKEKYHTKYACKHAGNLIKEFWESGALYLANIDGFLPHLRWADIDIDGFDFVYDNDKIYLSMELTRCYDKKKFNVIGDRSMEASFRESTLDYLFWYHPSRKDIRHGWRRQRAINFSLSKQHMGKCDDAHTVNWCYVRRFAIPEPLTTF